MQLTDYSVSDTVIIKVNFLSGLNFIPEIFAE